MKIKFTTIRKTQENMSVVEYINTPNHANRTSNAKIVDVELNSEGKYAAVMPYGRNWQSTIYDALAVATFTYDRPVIKGEIILQ